MKRLLGRGFGAFAIASGRVAAQRQRRSSQPRREPLLREPATTFEVHTFVTDDSAYAEMQRTFVAAGFDEARFVRLADNCSDPYAAISRIYGRARYPILCHQDVRLDRGAGAAELLAALEELDKLDPGWVVAGNAGVMTTVRIARRLRDPHGGSTNDPLPAQAMALDENFLVFNARNPAHCSPGLHGFHFYGTDVCLNALQEGGSAYIVDFPLTHLSGGTPDDSYESARADLVETWGRRYVFRYVGTPTGVIFFSRYRVLRRIFGSTRALTWARAAMISRSDAWWLDRG